MFKKLNDKLNGKKNIFLKKWLTFKFITNAYGFSESKRKMHVKKYFIISREKNHNVIMRFIHHALLLNIFH